MINSLLKNRFSTRIFSDKEIDKSIIIDLFEAARWSPSSGNKQPWRFIAGIKNEGNTHSKLVSILNVSNAIWAEKAPLLILAIAKKYLDDSQKLNVYSFYDVGLANANLTFQASTADLFVHQMGGFNGQKAKEVFEIPDDFEPVTVLAIGYLGNPTDFPEEVLAKEKRQRTRMELTEFVYEEKFGQISNLTTAPIVEENL